MTPTTPTPGGGGENSKTTRRAWLCAWLRPWLTWRRAALLVGGALLLSAVLPSFKEQTVTLDITPVTHTDKYIYTFTVNGAMGANISPVYPGMKFGVGSATTCCVTLPAKWRPGLKAHIVWFYSQAQNDPNPIPPPREAEVEIPPYGPHPENGDYGRFFVHFYPNHQVRVLVHRYDPDSEHSPDPDLSPVATGTLLKDEPETKATP